MRTRKELWATTMTKKQRERERTIEAMENREANRDTKIVTVVQTFKKRVPKERNRIGQVSVLGETGKYQSVWTVLTGF